MMSLDLALNLPDDLLLYTDKLTMHFALECRVPFLDSTVVELLMSLPSRYKVDVFGGKRLHRKLAQLELSREIVNRKKKGFLVPTARWFRESRKHWDILLGGAGLFSTTFDPAGVEDILRSHERGINLEKQIMMLLTCEALLNSSAQECE
jgi:asparagine synthase (glutamine-hydrolysing)